MFFRKSSLTSPCLHCWLFWFLGGFFSSFEGKERTAKKLLFQLNGPKKLSKTNIKGFSVFSRNGLSFWCNILGLPNLGNSMKYVKLGNPFVNLEQQRMNL